MSAARFEVVDTGHGHVARFVSGDGNKHSWTSRSYLYQRSALVAIYAFTGEIPRRPNGYPPDWDFYMVQGPKSLLEVRQVTEPIRYRPSARRPLPVRAARCALCGGPEGDCPCETGVEG